MEVQRALGVDIAMPLDHVLPGESRFGPARDAAERTLRWYERCRDCRRRAHRPSPSSREECTRSCAVGTPASSPRWTRPATASAGFPWANASQSMWAMTRGCTRRAARRPARYLMGVGSPEDLVNACRARASTCSIACCRRVSAATARSSPTTAAPTSRNARYRDRPGPIDPRMRLHDVHALQHGLRPSPLSQRRAAGLPAREHPQHPLPRAPYGAHAPDAIGAGWFADFAAGFLGATGPRIDEIRADQRRAGSNSQASNPLSLVVLRARTTRQPAPAGPNR